MNAAVAQSNQRLALTQVMMANSITSLRALTRLDWPTFVEEQSLMERVLRTDPAGLYTSTTFGTRDHYRHVVEHMARRSQRSEVEVARAAVDLAAVARRDGAARQPDYDPRREHVGYWLIDDGRGELELQTGYRMGPGKLVDIMIHDGLWDPYGDKHMGNCAELCAKAAP